jgi:hypothetical protein
LLAWVSVVEGKERKQHMWKSDIIIMGTVPRRVPGPKDAPGLALVHQRRRLQAKRRNGAAWQLSELCWVRLPYAWD